MITAANAIVLSLLFLSTVAAQSPPAPPPPYNFDPSPATIAVVVLSAIFFVVMFSLYLRLCAGSSTALLAPGSLRRRAATGLDDATMASFPVLHYSEIKEHKIGKNALECAICLNEFEDDETLRLIPKCDHVFHPECIDEWLGSHVTCPVCRANLLPNPEKPDTEDTTENISVRVVPQEVVNPDSPVQPPPDRSMSRRFGFVGKFPRSHSTGHSLVVVQPGDNTDRFTLRLPDHIRKEVMTRALSRTATFSVREGSSHRSRRTGEGSSRGARSYKRLDREVKSDRWVITVPLFTSQSRSTAGDGDGSTGRGVRTAVKLPSFKCLEPSASGDVVNAGALRQAV